MNFEDVNDYKRNILIAAVGAGVITSAPSAKRTDRSMRIQQLHQRNQVLSQAPCP